MNKKADSMYAIVAILVLCVIGYFIFTNFKLFSLVGIGKDYTLITEVGDVVFHTDESFFIKDGCIAEHNGAYTAVFKNLLDWMSRIEGKTFYGKPMLLMATSTGKRGGQSVLEMAKSRFLRHNANIIAEYSLPEFKLNFSDGKIINPERDKELRDKVKQLSKFL